MHFYISRYLAGYGSDSDSEDEDSTDDDDDEPEENSNRESESREDEKFDESKYWKKVVDVLKAKFTERFRILKKTNPDILPLYSNPKQKPEEQQPEQPKDAAEFTCKEPGCGKICSSSAGLKNHARKHRRGGRQTTAVH